MGNVLAQTDAVDAAIDAAAESTFAFLARLVAAPSLVGNEDAAQALIEGELARLGFVTERVPITEAVAERAGSGVPQLSYSGRNVIVGRRAGIGRSLLVNGHIDVVPADPELWLQDPFAPVVRDGWLCGRGAGDMKGGLAMALLAIEALLQVMPEQLLGPLSVVSVIEEECTGNGTLAAGMAGVLADAVLLPEPTDLMLMLEGIGILWFELVLEGSAVHAHEAQAGVNAIELALPLLAALRELEREINGGSGNRYALNIGTFRGGDWQSSVPGRAVVGARLGFPADWSPETAQQRVLGAIDAAAASHSWLAEHPPRVVFNGFRAEGYSLPPEAPLVRAVADAHEAVFGAAPAVAAGTATTDARFYLNQFGVPALCYGPRVRNIHGADEAVELASIVAGARVLARFIGRWLGADG